MKIKCPNCLQISKINVLETRTPKDSKSENLRRRRCKSCGFTFWTTEATKIKMEVQPSQKSKKSPSNIVSVKIEIKDLHFTAVQELTDAVESILEKHTVH